MNNTPVYTYEQVASLIDVSLSELRKWTKVRTFRTKKGFKSVPPLIKVDAVNSRHLLSFDDLIQCYFLKIIQKLNDVKLSIVQSALDSIEYLYDKPLCYERGVDLFLENLQCLLKHDWKQIHALRLYVESMKSNVIFFKHDDVELRAREFLPTVHYVDNDYNHLICLNPSINDGKPTMVRTNEDARKVYDGVIGCGYHEGRIYDEYESNAVLLFFTLFGL